MRHRLTGILGGLFVLATASQCTLYENVSPPNPDAFASDTHTTVDTAPDTGTDTVGDIGRCEGADAGAPKESCNGRDDDGDGIVDENCPCDFDDTSAGVCGEASRGPNGNCVTPAHWQSDESACDDRDNDCDDVVDEGCLCNHAGRSAGICQNQTVDEDGNCPRPQAFEQQESTCDDLVDNDCDGDVDDRDGDCRRRPGTRCTADPQCLSGHCLEETCAHRLFVTSTTTTGDIGGLDGGETICQEAAASADLDGRWDAVLSVDGHPANQRIEVAGPVVNTDGERFADGADDLWDFEHPNSIEYDQYGSAVDQSNVWTGTTAPGGVGNKRCEDWTTDDSSILGIIGWTWKSNNAWVHAGGNPKPCSNAYRLYCVDGQ